MVDFRECDRSDLGHAWYRIDDPAVDWGELRVFRDRRVSRCERCSTTRYVCVDTLGAIAARWYSYPDGWRDRWGVGNRRPTGDEIRLMMAQAALAARRETRKKERAR